MGHSARSFAAPGWRTNDSALLALDEANLAYRSDTRGRAPYRCIVEGRILKTIEIPTTLPTLDEVMGLPEIPDAAAAHRFYLEQFKDDVLNVHTVHAETEGMGQLEMFTALLRALKEQGAEFVRLEEVSASLNAEAAAGLSGGSIDATRPRRLDFRARRADDHIGRLRAFVSVAFRCRCHCVFQSAQRKDIRGRIGRRSDILQCRLVDNHIRSVSLNPAVRDPPSARRFWWLPAGTAWVARS